jgi:molybdopterin-guanine dinucleotide biosynthesis protein A
MTGRRVSAIVLAGGRSSRFGRDKLAEPIGGRTLLQHTIDAVRPFATEIIVVSSPDRWPAVAGDVRLIHDPSPFEGPLAGLAAGLAAAREASVFLTAGDIPGLVPEVVELLLGALDDPGVEIAVLADDDALQPFRWPCYGRTTVPLDDVDRAPPGGFQWLDRRLFSTVEGLASRSSVKRRCNAP